MTHDLIGEIYTTYSLSMTDHGQRVSGRQTKHSRRVIWSTIIRHKSMPLIVVTLSILYYHPGARHCAYRTSQEPPYSLKQASWLHHHGTTVAYVA